VGFGTLAIFDQIGAKLSSGMADIAADYIEAIDKKVAKNEENLYSLLDPPEIDE